MPSSITPPSLNTSQSTDTTHNTFDTSLSSQNMFSKRPTAATPFSHASKLPTSYSNPTVTYEHSVAFQSSDTKFPLGNSVTISAEKTPDNDKKSSKAGLWALGGIVLTLGGIIGGIAGSYAADPENKDRPPGSGR